MQRSVGRDGVPRDIQPLTPARERRVVRGVETSAHHGQDRPDEALGLAQWQAEDEPECERRLDRQIREPLLPSRSTGWRSGPGGPGAWGEPQRHVAPPDECAIVRPPIPHPIPRLVGRMDSRLHPPIMPRARPARQRTHADFRSEGPGAVHQRHDKMRRSLGRDVVQQRRCPPTTEEWRTFNENCVPELRSV